jgi:hypothetical protein
VSRDVGSIGALPPFSNVTLKLGYTSGAQSVVLRPFAKCPMEPFFFLLRRWHYSPVLTFTFFVYFSQSALFFDLIFHFLIVFINTCLYTVPPSVFWSPSYPSSLRIIVKYLTYFSLTIPSVNMTKPIQPTYSDKLKYIYISKQLH